jgi:hypothetical protein
MRKAAIAVAGIIANVFAGPTLSLGQSPAFAGDTCATQHILATEQEKRWIQAVRNRKTADGATVQQVLEYAEKMRPREFKVETIEVGYNCETGNPTYVGIGFWIGMKRLPDDVFLGLGYDVSTSEPGVKLSVPENPIPSVQSITEALDRGRDAFLSYIDDDYETNCVDEGTKRKFC